MARVTPIKTQYATLADAARMNLLMANELMRRLVQSPDQVDDECVRAVALTNDHLTKLLEKAPTLVGSHGG